MKRTHTILFVVILKNWKSSMQSHKATAGLCVSIQICTLCTAN